MSLLSCNLPPARVLALSAVALAIGCAPPPCTRAESIVVRLRPDVQLNQDRDGYSRSLVMRVYQLRAVETFRQIPFEALWSRADDAEARDAVVARPAELTVLPGTRAERVVPRAKEAAFVAVVANFREHEPGSRWQALVPLRPPPRVCAPRGPLTATQLDVALKDFGMTLR